MNRYLDEYGALLEDWLEDQGIPDALWRTAIGYICYKDPRMLEMINSCFVDGYAYRHPSHIGRNDCSRDQVIMAFCALLLSGEPLPALRWKFSDKFNQSGMWLWNKAIRGNKLATWLFLTGQRLTLPVKFAWNDLIWKHFNKHYWKLRHPFYAVHLMSWMVYVLPESKARERLRKYCYSEIGYQDITNCLLLRLHWDDWSASAWWWDKPCTDFRWQRRLDRMPPGIRLDYYNGDYPIDVDILKTL